MKYLNSLEIDDRAIILSITEGAGEKRLRELGFTDGSVIECVGESPMGDPRAYLIRGSVIALRRRDAARIIIGRITDAKDS